MNDNISINNSLLTNHNNSSISETKNKKIRKDAKGNLILKKESKNLKSKFHVHLIDNIYPGKQIANIVNIESYKKYNLEEEEEEEKNIDNNFKSNNQNIEIDNNQSVIKQNCCNIF
jgi:hypothetical protein